MNWPKEYLAAIYSGEEVVGHKVRAVYERECGWMDNPPPDFPFYFDPERGEHHIEFIERFCKHSKGRMARKPVRLELFQKAKLQLVFGWVEKENDLRRFREVIDIRGRKCGKSTETAAVEWDMLLNDGEGGAEIYCTANKKDQSMIVFNEAANMRSQSPALKAITKKRQSDIYFPMAFSFIKALATDKNTMDGLNAHFFSLDEWHAAKTSQVYDDMLQSQTARDQPLAWLISSNGFVRELFFDQKYATASKIALWEKGFQDYKTLPLIYELDSREEWQNPKCWAKANPGLGRIKSIATLAAYVEKAKREPSFLPTVLAKDFNLPENSEQTWLAYEDVVNETVVDMEYLRKSYAIGGCDLSATTDLTCATLLIRKPGDPKIYVLQKYFIPEARVSKTEQSSNMEAPYRLWAKDNWIEICPGASVDFHAVTEWFVHMVKEWSIRPLWICYDRALSGYWVPEMVEYGFEMEKVAQGPFTWTYPMKDLGGALENKMVVYQNNPVLRWCLNNTAKKSTNEKGVESIQPVKKASNLRIDGMVSLLNAWVGYSRHIDEYMSYLR